MSWHRRARWWVVFTRRPIRSARSLTTSRSIITWWKTAKAYEAPPLRVACPNLSLIRLVPLPRGGVRLRRRRSFGRRSIINALWTSSSRKHLLMIYWNRVVLAPRFPRMVQRPGRPRKNKDRAYPYMINFTADLDTSDIAAIRCCTRSVHFLYIRSIQNCAKLFYQLSTYVSRIAHTVVHT